MAYADSMYMSSVQVDIDLPQIAVIGSQSAGKSSLIESISGITLPRAAGTCTRYEFLLISMALKWYCKRCPTECRLARSDRPWQCIVSLRFVVDPSGQPLGQARNHQFGDVIYDKAKVEDRIRRAQLAILNPNKPLKYFLDNEEDHIDSQLSFSQNCVTLQISGPDIADLSFCDLPGMFKEQNFLYILIGWLCIGLIASQSSSRGGRNDIALVESLVTSYIKKQSCIILLTVACESQSANF